MPARDLKRLKAEIAAARKRFGLSSLARVVSCYEAGRDGFWLHRYLLSIGVENVVVDSSSIEVNRRARRAKSDGLDVGKLLIMLIRFHLGEKKVWSVVRVPSVEEEDRRQLHRELRSLRKERTRTTNRIRGLLASLGIGLSRSLALSGEQLERLRMWDGSPLPGGMKGRLGREWEHVGFLHKRILQLQVEQRRQVRESKDEAIQKVRHMARLRGIGEPSAWVLVGEFFGWRQFRNRREVGSLAGLTPTPYQSGESSLEQGISKAGNRQVRGLMIELAWIWLRYQPGSRLAQWYQRRFGGGGSRVRRVGIVALARKLLIDLWKFVEDGVLPEGAELKG
jgi:transposase